MIADFGILDSLIQILGKEYITENELMSRHTTFRTGGPASLFLRPGGTDELMRVIAALKDAAVPYFILGNGSNILVSDKGYEGAVISLERMNRIGLQDENGVEVKAETQAEDDEACMSADERGSASEGATVCIRAEAGALNSAIAALARDSALTGFEFAAGIPGTIGGAMIMNAGAYGGEMKDITRSVDVCGPDGNIVTLTGDECIFGYRTSRLKKEGYIVLSALLQLKKGDKDLITEAMKELAIKRSSKQPLEYPSAGSTFKRPEGYFAGKLIEDAHLRGFAIGDAAVSDKHCGFVINKGEATSANIYALINEVIRRVKEDSGVTLEPEVIMIGEF